MEVTWNKWERVASDRNWLAKTIWALLKLEADKVRGATNGPASYTGISPIYRTRLTEGLLRLQNYINASKTPTAPPPLQVMPNHPLVGAFTAALKESDMRDGASVATPTPTQSSGGSAGSVWTDDGVAP